MWKKVTVTSRGRLMKSSEGLDCISLTSCRIRFTAGFFRLYLSSAITFFRFECIRSDPIQHPLFPVKQTCRYSNEYDGSKPAGDLWVRESTCSFVCHVILFAIDSVSNSHWTLWLQELVKPWPTILNWALSKATGPKKFMLGPKYHRLGLGQPRRSAPAVAIHEIVNSNEKKQGAKCRLHWKHPTNPFCYIITYVIFLDWSAYIPGW